MWCNAIVKCFLLVVNWVFCLTLFRGPVRFIPWDKELTHKKSKDFLCVAVLSFFSQLDELESGFRSHNLMGLNK